MSYSVMSHMKSIPNLKSVLLCSVFAISTCLTAAPQRMNQMLSRDEESVRKFLRTQDDSKNTRYIAAFRDLNGDGISEALVYLLGNNWCGSGGCNLLILQRAGDSWKVITSMTITNPPIRVLDSTVNGWHSLGVWVKGGGIHPGYEAVMRFNGKKYPGNPSVPPAVKTKKGLPGEVVIRSIENAKPVY
jgi:hypothetical protein